MMLAQGATMTASWGAERVIVRDNRHKAVVGYVPFGYSFQPMFGDSNQASNVRVPHLALAALADVVAPISRTSQMIEALGGRQVLCKHRRDATRFSRGRCARGVWLTFAF